MEKETQRAADWSDVQDKLESSEGPRYWRSLDELAETPEFTQWQEDEFPHRRSIPEVDRRGFLKVMGASVALAGLVGCRSLPHGKLIPTAKAVEDRVTGLAYYYASAAPFNGYAYPVIVESHEGRPTKIDGNPEHPWTAGGRSDAFVQAEILNLYDPDRPRIPFDRLNPSSWADFYTAFRAQMKKGGKVALLTGRVTSPTTARLIAALQKKMPNLEWRQYEIAHNDNEMAGTQGALGYSATPIFDFSKAKAVLSLDGDFLAGGPHTVKYAADFVKTRDPEGTMSRLYAVESSPNLTGAYADHRYTCKPSEMEAVAAAIGYRLGVGTAANMTPPKSMSSDTLDAIAADLRDGGMVVVGAHQTPFVHAMAAMINRKNGVNYVPVADFEPTPKVSSLALLANDLASGEVQSVIILGGNPVYGAPGDLKFGEALAKAKFAAYCGLFANETSELCHWMLPQSHFLEAWGDMRTPDGSICFQQPLIEPLYDTKSFDQVLASLAGSPKTPEALVKETHAGLAKNKQAWEKAIADGFIASSAIRMGAQGLPMAMPQPSAKGGAVEAVFIPDPTVFDGFYANNGWLQELPKPLTKLCWDNAVLMGPNMAVRLGVGDEQKVRITSGDRVIEAGVFVQPGHPDDVVTLTLGYGRTHGGEVLKKTGFDFGKLRSLSQSGFGEVQIEKIGGVHRLVTAQSHHSMEGRPIYREGTVADYAKDATLNHGHHEHETPGFYNLTADWAKEHPEMPQWGMTIDLNTCTGCNACVTACQSENNIVTVGKDEVGRGREMHWLRIDRYYRVTEGADQRDFETGVAKLFKFEAPIHTPLSGPIADEEGMDPNRVATVFQPMTCMHCETAPCEPVCPVAATVHSHEGLNQMVYNRCVGTRYCSNNCPYKVRRFNFYNYQHGQVDQLSLTKNADGSPKLGKDYGNRNFRGEDGKPLMHLIQNPDVTVRSRGVMEKCTYCVQRINEARITAKKERRDLRDGDVVTACQQACPAGAISFGNIADKKSVVSKNKAKKRNYKLLAEIGTNPRTTYLGRVRNPNPVLAKSTPEAGH